MSELFLEILNTAITAGWLVLAVLLVRLPLKKAPAWVRCALWAIVALRLVWPFEIESILSLIPSKQTLPPAELYAPAPQIHTGVTALNSAINPVFTPTFTPEPANSVNPLQVAVAVASVVWVIGMLLMAAYTAISYLRLRRMVRVSMPAGEGVYLCDNISSPFILGIVKPRIYLPSDLPEHKWVSVLAHERAHLARKDHWWKPLGFLLLTVFWFHPLLWLAYILLCRDVELACDEKVIKTLSDEEKRSYSQTLLDCSVPRKWIAACPLAFGETGVKQRIKAVLHYKKPTLWIIIAALLLCSVLAVCFLTEPVDTPEEEDGQLYVIGQRVAGIITTGYFRDLEGYVRITGDGNLELVDQRLTDTNDEFAWMRLGKMEEVTLKPECFVYPLGDADTLTALCEKNEKAWRVAADDGVYHYFLQQKDGTCYFLFKQQLLYELCSREWGNVAGKTFFYEKAEFGWEFTITIHEDGTVTYSEGTLSSHLGVGDWTLDGDLLCIEETRAFLSGLKVCTYYFKVTEGALIFQADLSDSFTYLDIADGAYFFEYKPEEHQQQSLLWVNVVQRNQDAIIALDGDGNYWWFDLQYATVGDIEEGYCWIRYYEPNTVATEHFPADYPVKYVANAARCWRYAGVLANVSGTIYDCCQFDVDGDGKLEDCVLSADSSSSGYYHCKLTVWDGETCKYGVSFRKMIIADEDSFGYLPSDDAILTPAAPVGYMEAFAFVSNCTQLQIVTPYDAHYASTGKLKTYNVVFADGNLSVVDA